MLCNKAAKASEASNGRACKTSLQASVPNCIFYLELEILLFQKELKKYSFKFGLCSKHWAATYFIETQHVSACFLAYSATTPVILSREV